MVYVPKDNSDVHVCADKMKYYYVGLHLKS